MSNNAPPRPLRRSFSSAPFVTPRSAVKLKSTSGETSPLLHRQREEGISRNDYPSSSFTNREPVISTSLGRSTSPEAYSLLNSRQGSLRRFLRDTLGREQWYGHRTARSPRNPIPHRQSYDQFTSIDWMQDLISDSRRQRSLGSRRGILRRLHAQLYRAQGWILTALVGFLVAVVAYFINITEIRLFDTKFGFCRGSWLSTRVDCKDWISWGRHTSSNHRIVFWMDFGLYMFVMLALTVLSCLLVLGDKHVIRPPRPGTYNDKATPEVVPAEDNDKRQIILYPSAGSGVAEVKVISSGFVLHGFLGLQTLIFKSAGCILSAASGLSIGKEGPFVHIAACIGNTVSRLFPAYGTNSGKRREIISASSAAGIAVAFGAPISGVTFALEETSYYFPAKTFFRTFFCSIIAAVGLKFLNPYLNGRIVPFEVKYSSDWRAFEMPLFVILGALGGAIGALVVKGTRVWARVFRRHPWIMKHPLLEAALIALVSGVASYWNRFTSSPVGLMMFELASDCETYRETSTGLCPSKTEIPSLIVTLTIAFVIRAVLTIITFGIKIPAGIYVPSMVIGGILGRGVGHALQYAIISLGPKSVFGSCARDDNLEGCIVPGVYALLTAGATMCGVTRLSLTLALILFELSGITYILPFSIAVLVAKWTADAIEPQSIYDMYMEMNAYPYLDNKNAPNLTGELADFTPRIGTGRMIDISQSALVPASMLREDLDFLVETGQFDGGLPILKDELLMGLISCHDLAFCLDRLKDKGNDVLCWCSPHTNSYESDEEYFDTIQHTDLTDFSAYIDPAPLALDEHSSMELVFECFVKLGLRYICVSRNGRFAGLVHKKAFIKYAREA